MAVMKLHVSANAQVTRMDYWDPQTRRFENGVV